MKSPCVDIARGPLATGIASSPHGTTCLNRRPLRVNRLPNTWQQCRPNEGLNSKRSGPMIEISPQDYARFWSKIGVRNPDECWPWRSGKDSHGYGHIKIKGQWHTASRLALGLYLGRPVKPGLSACHHCDNPECVNPSHLYEGTQRQNMRDMTRRGRAAGPPSKNRGQNNPRARLTAEDVSVIRKRARCGVSRTALSEEYGVSSSHISSIVLRKSWESVA